MAKLDIVTLRPVSRFIFGNQFKNELALEISGLRCFGSSSGNGNKEILELAWSSKHLSYLEAKYQFTLGCLEKEIYNDKIQGRYFKKDLVF